MEISSKRTFTGRIDRKTKAILSAYKLESKLVGKEKVVLAAW